MSSPAVGRALCSPPLLLSALFALSFAPDIPAGEAAVATWRFDFGSGPVARDFVRVRADSLFNVDRSFGFESGAGLTEFMGKVSDPPTADGVESPKPFFFSAVLPAEGNHRVTVTLGHPEKATATTIKAELRRLMFQDVRTAPGEFVTRSFIVNTRTHRIAARHAVEAGVVDLKAPRETTQEAWAWDDALTLEFNGANPSVYSLVIEPIEVPTIFLLGDSTVCDQSLEPYNSWGQMLPAFFTNEVAVANHGESGETYRDSISRRRLDKVISVMEPGDWLFMQFGHNDQKQIAAGTGGPFTTYQEELRHHIAAVRGASGNLVVVTPMERRAFGADGRVRPSLAEYAQASRDVAKSEGVACLDLHAMSIAFYEALGPERSALAFAAPRGVVDNTHHNNYGSHQLARCIVQAIRDSGLEIARFVRADVPAFDPGRPDAPESFAVPPSPLVTSQRPLGD